jgi:Zn-dependent peptidase ImmA (M78 family)/transcriptional regulator with XRE-family HTH domain
MDRHVLNTIDARVLGERLADARRARNLTQQAAADALGVSRTTITAMEKGDRRPRAAELVSLAHLYGQSVSAFVQPERKSPAPGFLIQFRSTRGMQAGEREADIRKFEQLCRWYIELEEMLGSPLPRRYPLPYDISGTSPDRAAEEVATSERNRLGLGDAPVGDLWAMLETDIGLRVFPFGMEDRRIAGMYLYAEEYGGCIAINANQPEDRRRMSGAHEYAHFLTDRSKPEISILHNWKRMPEAERFADAFARNFLMPSSGLNRRFEAIRRAKPGPVTPADVLSLSHLFGVSANAMTWRLEELKLLPAGTWDRLKDFGFKPNEARKLLGLPIPSAGSASLPLRYQMLAVQAYEDELLTEGQLAERLLTDRIGARDLINDITLQPQPADDGTWHQVALDLTAALVGE